MEYLGKDPNRAGATATQMLANTTLFRGNYAR